MEFVRPRLDDYTAHLRELGAIRTPEVEVAFRTVPRHQFAMSFYDPNGKRVTVPQAEPVPAEILDLVYSNTALVTHLSAEQAPISSTSQPELIANMLEALKLAPGLRVLEIGAGTGYNAALIATITGTQVTSIDVQVDVATQARQALRRAGITDVTVLCGDGYQGHPEAAPYQRIIVTVACTGVSARWLDQLDENGFILAPIAHAGVHPLLAIRRDRGQVDGQAVMWADFMRATGPLYHWPDPNRPLLTASLEPAEYENYAEAVPELCWDRYTDLWFFLATRDPRITRAVMHGIDPAKGPCALLDPEKGTAFIQRDGVRLAGHESLLEEVTRLVHQWEERGRPAIPDWTCTLVPVGSPETPIYVPTNWQRRSGLWD